MRFNINYEVRVKLTDEGRRVHRENHDSLFAGWQGHGKPPAYMPPKEDKHGWSRWQLYIGPCNV